MFLLIEGDIYVYGTCGFVVCFGVCFLRWLEFMILIVMISIYFSFCLYYYDGFLDCDCLQVLLRLVAFVLLGYVTSLIC